MKRLLLFVCLVGAALCLLTPPPAVPVGEDKISVAQAQVDSNQRADRPLGSSWGSTLKSLRRNPNILSMSKRTERYRQVTAYQKKPNQRQTDPQITRANDVTGSIDQALTTATGASDEAANRWARVTFAATLYSEPSLSSLIVGYSSPGKEVQIREYKNGWFRVQNPGTEESGWIFHKYLEHIYGPTPAPAQIAATAKPPANVVSSTSQKPARIAKPAVRASHDRKVSKRQARRSAERAKRRRGLGLFKRRQAGRAWSLGPAN